MALQDELDAKTTKDLADITARLDALSKPQPTVMAGGAPFIPAFAGSNAGPVMLTPTAVVKPVQIQQAPPVSQAQTQTAAQNDLSNLTSIGKKVDTTQQASAQDQSTNTPTPPPKFDLGQSQIDVMSGIAKQLQDQIAPKIGSDNSVDEDIAGFKKDIHSIGNLVNDLFGKTTADTASTNQAVSRSGGGGAGDVISAVGDIGAAAGIGSGIGALGTAASIAADSAAVGSAGAGILSTIGEVLGVLAWIICTELVAQKRMPSRWWIVGAKVFAAYPEEVKQGYYLWAIPSVRHLRAHPFSLYSRFLCLIFNWRAENIACAGGVKGAKKNWKGAAVTVILWPICYVTGFCLVRANLRQHWQSVYNLESK